MGGDIHNIKTCKVELAGKAGVSLGKLYNTLSYLYQEGLCWEDEGGGLRFMSKDRVAIKLCGYSVNKKHHLSGDVTVREIDDFMIRCSIDSNLKNQEYIVRNKFVDEEVKKYGNVKSEKVLDAIKRSIRKKSFKSLVLNKRVQGDFIGGNTNSFNSDVTLSRRSVAALAGLSSASSGSNLIKRLVAAGHLTDTINIDKMMSGVTKSFFDGLHLPSNYFFKNGCILQRRSNTISTGSL